MCVFLLEPCVLVSLDWVEPMMIFLLHVTWSCIFHAYVLFFSLFGISVDWCFSTCLSLFLYFFLSQIVCAWHPSANPLRPGTLFVPGNHLLLTLLHSMSGFVIWRLVSFSKNFSKRGIHSERHIILLDFSNTDLLTVIHKRGWESLCEISMSCPSMII